MGQGTCEESWSPFLPSSFDKPVLCKHIREFPKHYTAHCYTGRLSTTQSEAYQFRRKTLYKPQQDLRKGANNLTRIKMAEGLLALLHCDGEMNNDELLVLHGAGHGRSLHNWTPILNIRKI